MFDVVDRGREAAFKGENDAVGELLRGESGVVPDDRHDRDVDVGEDIDGCAHHRDGADDEEQQR